MMSFLNRQDPQAAAVRISSAAANAGQEIGLLEFGANNFRVISVRFVADSQIITSAAAGFVFALVNKGTAGTATDTVASLAKTAGDTVAALNSHELTVATAYQDVDAGEALSWKETTVGTGTARSNGVVVVEYTLR